MKKLILVIIIISALYSCKKDAGTSPLPPAYNITSLVSVDTSADSTAHATIYTFNYDVNSNLIHISYNNSTVDKYKNSWIDSGSQSFYYKQNESFPRNYTSIYRKSFYTWTSISNDTLIYNSQGRIMVDSVLSGAGKSSSNRYYYSGNIINLAEWNGNSISMDTIVLSNGNLIKMGWGFAYGDSYTRSNYSNYPNPFYNPYIANMLGALFTDGNWFDGLSVNLPDLGSATVTTDSQGRIVKLTGMGKGTTSITYK